MARKKAVDLEAEKSDVKKYINEIDKHLEEKLSEVEDIISSKIDERVEFKINKRMKEEEKRLVRGQKLKIIRLNLLVILLLAITVYFGYCLYKVDYFQIRSLDNNDASNSIDNVNTVIEDEKEDTTNQVQADKDELIEEYSYLLDSLKVEDESVFDLYKKELKSDDLSNDFLLKLAYKNLKSSNIEKSENTISFSAESIEDSLKRVLGKTNFKNQNFNYNNITFIFYNGVYIGLDEDIENSGFVDEIIDIDVNQTRIEFQVLVGRVTLEKELLDLDGKLIYDNYTNQDLTNYKESLNSFRVVFTKNDDNYVFSSIKKDVYFE